MHGGTLTEHSHAHLVVKPKNAATAAKKPPPPADVCPRCDRDAFGDCTAAFTGLVRPPAGSMPDVPAGARSIAARVATISG